MTTKKITELPAAASVDLTDLVPIVNLTGPTTKRVSVSQIGASLVPGLSASFVAAHPNEVLKVNASGTAIETTAVVASASFASAAAALTAQQEIIFVAGTQSTALSTFTRAGGRKVDLLPFPAVIGSHTRNVRLAADVQKTSGSLSIEVQLFDVTNNVQVTNTNLSHSADNSLIELTSSILTVGTSSGNIRTDVVSMYEFDAKMISGSVSDLVFVTNARLLISYS